VLVSGSIRVARRIDRLLLEPDARVWGNHQVEKIRKATRTRGGVLAKASIAGHASPPTCGPPHRYRWGQRDRSSLSSFALIVRLVQGLDLLFGANHDAHFTKGKLSLRRPLAAVPQLRVLNRRILRAAGSSALGETS
jgi:hypothetical protein